MTGVKNQSLKSALEAVGGYTLGKSTAFVCPYADCGALALHHWGEVRSLSVRLNESTTGSRHTTARPSVLLSSCEACQREVVFVDKKLVWPRVAIAPAPNGDMPDDPRSDYEEAMSIHRDSPRGAAALLRLALQKLLPFIGARSANINEAIGELVSEGVVPKRIQQALDAVRVIGNEAVHPGELNLRDDEATVQSLFGLLNIIVEKTISEPKEIEALYASLPAKKLDGIVSRDGAKAAPEDLKPNG